MNMGRDWCVATVDDFELMLFLSTGPKTGCWPMAQSTYGRDSLRAGRGTGGQGRQERSPERI